MASLTRTNALYEWVPPADGVTDYSVNGLNQLTAVGPQAISHDGRGNVTGDGGSTFTYNVINQLTSVVKAGVTVTLAYDPLGRLETTAASGATTRFLYSGDNLVAEYDGAGNLLRRYVPGPGVDEPLVWYEGAGTADRRFLHANAQGSIIAISNASGVVTARFVYSPGACPPARPGEGLVRPCRQPLPVHRPDRDSKFRGRYI